MILSNYLRNIAVKANGPLPHRVLGKTGLSVSLLGMGGESIIKIKDNYSDAVELLQSAYQIGINYFDTAPIYYPSEIRVCDALQSVRKDIIIASKTHIRTRDASWSLLEKSLENLKTDYLDIWQLHHIDHIDEVNQIFAPDGVLKALIEAKEQGVVRYIGITGHYDPKPLAEALNRFPFDTILMSLNAADVHQESFIKNVLPLAIKQNLGIIGMKVCSRGRIFDPTHLNNMEQALNYVYTLPVSTVIVGHDNIKQLIENALITQRFKPLTKLEMEQLEEKTSEYANLALFFRKGFEKFNPFWKPYGF